MNIPWDMEKIARLQDLRGFFDFDNPNMDCDKLKENCEGSEAQDFAEEYANLHQALIAFRQKYPQVYNQ
jgi:hypothetical protein